METPSGKSNAISNGGATGLGGRAFKESPMRHFEETPLPPSSHVDSDGADSAKLKAAGSDGEGEKKRDEEEEEEGRKGISVKRGGKKEGDVFARPTLTPAELAKLMPAPSISGTITKIPLPHAKAKPKAEASEKVVPMAKLKTFPPQSQALAKAANVVGSADADNSQPLSNKRESKGPLSLVSYSSEDSDSDADL